MIRGLRSRHRWMIALVAVVAGLLFVLALLVRPEWPIQAELPAIAPDGAAAGVEPGEPAEPEPEPASEDEIGTSR